MASRWPAPSGLWQCGTDRLDQAPASRGPACGAAGVSENTCRLYVPCGVCCAAWNRALGESDVWAALNYKEEPGARDRTRSQAEGEARAEVQAVNLRRVLADGFPVSSAGLGGSHLAWG